MTTVLYTKLNFVSETVFKISRTKKCLRQTDGQVKANKSRQLHRGWGQNIFSNMYIAQIIDGYCFLQNNQNQT